MKERESDGMKGVSPEISSSSKAEREYKQESQERERENDWETKREEKRNTGHEMYKENMGSNQPLLHYKVICTTSAICIMNMKNGLIHYSSLRLKLEEKKIKVASLSTYAKLLRTPSYR